MLIKDKIYGQYEINEPVLLELLSSKNLQRLKDLAQYGIPQELYTFPGFSRFEHSIGVMLLLKKLGADFEEQAAGLIHDISHPAFSHVMDWVWGNQINEDYQDNHHLNFLKNSEVKEILEKYGFNIERVGNFENFPLLEKEIPSLCADRLDYSLKEFNLWANPSIVKGCLKDLLAVDNKIVFQNLSLARDFAETYLKAQREHWAGFEAVSRYYRLSELFKKALEREILIQDDFWRDEMFVISKIYQSGAGDLIAQLEEMKEKTTSDKIGIIKKKKFRYIDPEILIDNEIKNLSLIDESFSKLLEEQRELNEKGVEI